MVRRCRPVIASEPGGLGAVEPGQLHCRAVGRRRRREAPRPRLARRMVHHTNILPRQHASWPLSHTLPPVRVGAGGDVDDAHRGDGRALDSRGRPRGQIADSGNGVDLMGGDHVGRRGLNISVAIVDDHRQSSAPKIGLKATGRDSTIRSQTAVLS